MKFCRSLGTFDQNSHGSTFQKIVPHGAPAINIGCAIKWGWAEGALGRVNSTLCKGIGFVFRAELNTCCRAFHKNFARPLHTT